MNACSVVSDYCDPMDGSHQAPLFMGFSMQEYWSGLPFPPPGDLPDPGIEGTCKEVELIIMCLHFTFHYGKIQLIYINICVYVLIRNCLF